MKAFFVAALLLAASLAPLAAQESVDLSGDGPGIKEITVTNEGFDFIPRQITVRKGDTVRLTYTNGGGFHDWVLDEFDAATGQFPGGRSETIEFVADEAGSFEFYCSVANHRARGMWGNFIVVE